MKNQKGITLVALVITIIVLLILAGVSISLVLGQNGVLTQAKNAAKTTTLAEAKQAIEQAISGAQGTFISTWNTNNNQKFLDHYLNTTTFGTEMGTSSDATYNWEYNQTNKKGLIKVNGEYYTFTLVQSDNGLGVKSITWSSSNGGTKPSI